MVSSIGGIGERQAQRYMCSVLKNLGYTPICVYSDKLIKMLSVFTDVFICSDQNIFCPKNSYNYLIVHKDIPQIKKKYDAILSVVPEEKVKKLYPNGPIVPFFFSVHSTKFCDSPKTRLFFGGDSWDRYRSRDVAKLYKLLDNTGYFDLYGTKSFGLNSYKGFIPYGENTILDAMRKSGVALVLHSVGHFKDDIPTARIFEAIAASTVVITDRLPFIVKNFGDSVLYIDRDKSSEEMFKQIDAHMKWILSHPQKAIELARQSHEIFLKNFTLERIMKNVMERYENSKKQQPINEIFRKTSRASV
ncbi:MAG: glycosyltransferase family 1 protein [Alphaproteobacteria bacterium]|nr:glycosyltransferase family 1 protein [Alphaproteobacteria bacterium]